MKTFLNQKIRLAFGFAILILLVMGLVSYQALQTATERSQWVRHTHEVIEHIQDLALTMESIESGSRGFVLTGNELYLAGYGENVQRAGRDTAAIQTMTVDNPAQQGRIPAIEAMTASMIHDADVAIELRRGAELDAVALGMEQARQNTGALQALLATMQGEEVRLLGLRMAEADHDRGITKFILIIGTLLGILIPGFAAWSALRDSTRRAIAEEALMERESRTRMLLEGVKDYAIFMLDPEGNVLSWSASAQHIKGYTEAEILGRNFSCFFLKAEIETGKPAEVLSTAARDGRCDVYGMRVRKDGTEFLSSVNYFALRDKGGKLTGFAELSRDMSEHEQSDAKYHGLLEAAPDGMVVVNRQGDIVLLNAQAEKQFGYRRDELLGQKVTAIIPTGFAERLLADGSRTASEALAQQIGTGIELNGLRKDGSEFPIEMMLSPLESPEGTLVTAAIRDITVRKDAERHLAQMEGRYRGLLEAAPDGMVVVDEQGKIVLLNAHAEKQFGYRRDELLGQRVTAILPTGFAERLIADGTRTAAEALAQQIGTGIELHGLRKDGTTFPLEMMLSPLESSEGILVTAAIRDISERKQLARQLHQSQKMEAIGQLTGGIAHDFNNLLGVIIGNLDLLDRMVADRPDAAKRLQTAQKAAMRGADITRRLLVFSCNEELRPSVIVLGESIQNVIDLATRGVGPEFQITAHVDERMPTVFVDTAGLESALMNLVVNARAAMPKGGMILIAAEVQSLESSHPAVQTGELKQRQYVHVSVSDTGVGMSKATLERAFEPFFTTKPRDKGTGLGLAMVYGFVKQSGGTVRVYSELGQGTTVSFYLPLSDQLIALAPVVPHTTGETRLTATVLVVDDDVDLLEVAVTYLREKGYKVLEARDAESALVVIAQHEGIDLMVTDIVMPGGMDGVELAKQVRKLQPEMRILYSSGFPARALAERSGPLIDGPLLRKPYQRSEFDAAIHAMFVGKDAEVTH